MWTFGLVSGLGFAGWLLLPDKNNEEKGEKNKMTGTVKWFNNKKGYGFITNENREDVFVHYSGINMKGFKTLPESANVTYEPVETERGVVATNVVVIENK